MPDTTDRQLIVQYVRHRDHEAFARLVHRYIALVRSAAMRQTRDPALADDVTQAAMIVLARRAREIPRNVVLASWLYTVTHHLSQNAIKARSRRTAHESIAASRRTDPAPTDRELREVLDAAIARLPEIERGGVVLHYFNDCTHEQIADAMGMTSEAVRKRVSRALVKMRDFLTRRGFDLSTPALSNALRVESGHATTSAVAMQSIVSVALLSASDAVISSSAPAILANGILGATNTALKWKIAASITLACAGFTGIASIPLTHPAAQATNGPMLAATTVLQAAAAPAAPATQPAGFVAEVTQEIRIEPLGCAPHPADGEQWFSIEGKPIAVPNEKLLDNQVKTDSRPDRQIAFLMYAPASTRFVVEIPGSNTSNIRTDGEEGQPTLIRARFGLDDPIPETLSVSFNISTSDWRTVATADVDGPDPVDVDADGLGPITIHPPADEDPNWGTHVDIRHPRVELIPQMIATDVNGKEHVHHTINSNSSGGAETTSSFFFSIPPKEIRSVKLQVREYDKRVEYTNISMQADQLTEPQVVVKDLKK